MIRKMVIVSLILGMTVWAAQDSVDAVEQSRLDKIEEAVSKVLSKAGINFGGEFRSQFLLSRVKGDAVDKAARKDEGVEYTSVDFDISARPHSALQTHLMFRLHQDWRNLWTSFKTPITSRWISVDGMVKNVFGYNVGDFRQKYSPLTLYSPDIDIEYEPEIFARLRKAAMKEMFLGDNERVMQGVNLNFDAEVVPLFKEFHFNALGSRLRTGELPESGSIVKLNEMDKYFFGTNLDLVFVPDVTFGGSFLQMLDARYTFAGTLESADVLQQKTRVYAGRGSVGTAPFIDEKKFNMKLSSEVAMSSDDSSWHDTTMITATTYRTTLQTERIQGVALSADLNSFIKLGTASDMNIGVGFIRNSKDFRNELAQSPTFYPARIMNSENDAGTANLYSTFDALYRHVFKFAPSENSGWTKGPMSKVAYFNGILTQDEIESLYFGFNNPLCLAMPYGPATANRMGGKGKLAFTLADKAIHVSASGCYLQEVDGMAAHNNPNVTMPKSSFYEAGGGLSIDFASFGDWWPYPFILSGGYKLSDFTNDGLATLPLSQMETNVGLANAGLYWTFWKRASLLGGFQLLKTTIDGYTSNVKSELTELHWAAGLEYKVSDGGTLTGAFGFNDVTYSDETDANASMRDFRQWQTDLYLTVDF